jgi:phosphoadenosine phosphosulfate reductase
MNVQFLNDREANLRSTLTNNPSDAFRPVNSRPETESLDLTALAAGASVLIRRAISAHPDSIALVSSFGSDSAALLHLVATIDRTLPIIFLDTGRHFPETLAYVDTLKQHLGLTNLSRIRPSDEDIATLDPDALRAKSDPDGCCDFRKVKTLAHALEPFDAWISGRKRFQSATRQSIREVEQDGRRLKYNPMAAWSSADISAYRSVHDLPQHPLSAKGFLSIGCVPCTTAVLPGEDQRSGRWRGLKKAECGIHQGDRVA